LLVGDEEGWGCVVDVVVGVVVEVVGVVLCGFEIELGFWFWLEFAFWCGLELGVYLPDADVGAEGLEGGGGRGRGDECATSEDLVSGGGG
jgi:hypothetical protein